MIDDNKMKHVREAIHVCECKACGRTFDSEWKVCPNCGSKNMDYGFKKVKLQTPLQKRHKMLITQAKIREEALDYEAAIEIWETLGNIEEAARIRKIISKQKSVKVAQKVVKGDEINQTEIKDSVLNKSNVGSGGSSKMQELRELKEMFDSGFISKEEMEDMKKEILGK